jgi:hypothetical protein
MMKVDKRTQCILETDVAPGSGNVGAKWTSAACVNFEIINKQYDMKPMTFDVARDSENLSKLDFCGLLV